MDRQVGEKAKRAQAEKEEKKLYEDLQNEHVKLLGQREVEKANAVREKIMQEKESRDRQLKEEKIRKRKEEKEAFQNEVELVQRLRDEMVMEQAMQAEKRRQEKEYLQKMLRENEANKKKAEGDKAEQQRADIKAQTEYAKLLDKQEADRQHEFQQREARAQGYMSQLASQVIGKEK